MAKRTVVTVIDDIDGSEGAETIQFGLDGLGYEIDLGKNHADALREALSLYVAHAQKVSSGSRHQAGAKRVTAGSNSKAVRNWAAVNGIDVPAAGRVPKTVLAQWEAAGSPA